MSDPQFQDSHEWVAHYNDGDLLTEYERDSDEVHGFRDVDLDRLKLLTLEPKIDGRPHIGVLMNEQHADMRPIFFRRRRERLANGSKETIHCIGWQRTVHGVNVKTYAWIFEDGSILLSDEDVV